MILHLAPWVLQAVVDCGALDCLVQCLEEFDPGVREAAAWALGYVAGHSADLAGTVRSPASVANKGRSGIECDGL